MEPLTARFSELIDAGDNILVLCRPFVSEEPRTCADLLTVEDPDQENVLSVTLTESPCARLDLCDKYAGTHPAEAVLIGTDTRSRTSFSANNDCTDTPPELTIDRISSPADLTSLGVTITNYLDEWKESSAHRQIVTCFHSVTTLLQYVDLQLAFEFFHRLTTMLTEANALSHYHIDPTAHDEQVIKRFLPLFDQVFEYQDGDWTH